MPRRGDLVKATKINGEFRENPFFGLYYGRYPDGEHTGWVSTYLDLRLLRKKFGEGANLDQFRILVPLEFM